MSKPPSTHSRATRSDAQRQAILDAACLLFIDRGFGRTNINDIADAVGVTCTLLRSDENC
jgi:AcrR family transcriptional regulator